MLLTLMRIRESGQTENPSPWKRSLAIKHSDCSLQVRGGPIPKFQTETVAVSAGKYNPDGCEITGAVILAVYEINGLELFRFCVLMLQWISSHWMLSQQLQ
ncbi:hypothetical protein CEXT_17631 [Caerostris extrusa]|uniref:Uncharacterized protein n=1 Tax=Caerostris extrusa TaxID=172846 RepID=A0AAV4MU79_CAEEX|nr:hypothetical protein CEXT_17631 [Caerostris extrusa]